MADLEERVGKLEERVKDLEIDINKTLSIMQVDLQEIKQCLISNEKTGDLKNENIAKDVDSNTRRIEKLENNQSKLVWIIISEVIGLIFAIVIACIKVGK